MPRGYDLQDWVDRYVAAWRHNEAVTIASLFASDAVYRSEPYAEPWRGRGTIVRRWLENRDGLGDFGWTWRPVCVTADVAVVQGLAQYQDQTYSILWTIGLNDHGECRDFTEWRMKHPEEKAGITSVGALPEISLIEHLPSSAIGTTDLRAWVDRYIEAWKGNDPKVVRGLFAVSGVLQTEPYTVGVHGIDDVLGSWLANPEKLGDFTFQWRTLVITDAIAIVEGLVTFATETYSVLWPLRFDAEGRCLHFLEWYMQHPAKEAAVSPQLS